MIDEATLRRLIDEGKSDAEIGRAHGIHYNSVGKIRKRYGIPSSRKANENKMQKLEWEIRKLVTTHPWDAFQEHHVFEDCPEAVRGERGGRLPSIEHPATGRGSFSMVDGL